MKYEIKVERTLSQEEQMKSLSNRTYQASISDLLDRGYSKSTQPNRVTIRGATITCSTFIGSDFRGLDLEEVDFSGSEFRDCDFRGCTFKKVDLNEVIFYRCNFILAKFVETDVAAVRGWEDCKGEVVEHLVIEALRGNAQVED
jgi:uncharacterized protein YjbI with pentapeptide repeats